MTKIYTLLLFVLTTISTQAQIIYFPSSGFKSRLLAASASNMYAKNLSGSYFKIDANNDGEIEVSEAQQVSYLMARQCGSSSFSGIENFTNLQYLIAEQNSLTSLNLSACINLVNLDCSENYLTSLNVTGSPNLQGLFCENNNLTSLNISNNILLKNLHCSGNAITNVNTEILTLLEYFICDDNMISYIDITGCRNLTQIWCDNNPPLTTLLVKNGKTNVPSIYNCPNLTYICCDDSEMMDFQDDVNLWNYPNCQVNSYCSFVPGGVYYTVQPRNIIDSDNNGCDSNDPFMPYVRYNVDGLTTDSVVISGNTTSAIIALTAGNYTITPVLENPTYFTISPISTTVSFPANSSPFIQEFCLSQNGAHPDVEIAIFPVGTARPGFQAAYKLVYKNKGNNILSGSISMDFDDAHTDLVTSTPLPNGVSFGNLSWDYSNLEPFETREITFKMHINAPTDTPPVNMGYQLNYGVVISPLQNDETPIDNNCSLKQIVVNSLDPNDKTCVEGTTITPSMVGEYVHYIIRFENTGTFAAENIVVKDVIDTSKFDIATLIPLSSSHSFFTRIINTNVVEFIFENINLPFDDANNDGYVAFKIKTKPTLVVGDTFSNSANIYFDYNFPIVTNTYTTIIQALNNQDFEFSSVFSLSPVPTKNKLTITVKESIVMSSVSIYNTLGQLVQVNTNPSETIDVSGLQNGNYFIKISSDKGSATGKFIKE